MRICQRVPLLVLPSYGSQMILVVDAMICMSQGNRVIARARFSVDVGAIQIGFIPTAKRAALSTLCMFLVPGRAT